MKQKMLVRMSVSELQSNAHLIFAHHNPVDTGRKLNVRKTFNLRPLSAGKLSHLNQSQLSGGPF